MKKVLSLLLSALLLLSIVPFSSLTVCADGESIFWYSILSDQTAAIVDYEGYEENVTIPSVVDGYQVTTIADGAFENCSFTNISIPQSVTYIGNSAFANCRFTNIQLPNNLLYLGAKAFSSCTNLNNITIPSGVTMLLDQTFSGCLYLTNVSIPSSVILLGNSVFSGCHSLQEITIPDSVVRIGNNAFRECYDLLSVRLPSNLETIEAYTFYHCRKLVSCEFPKHLKSIEFAAFELTSLTEAILPEGLNSIGRNAFNYSNLFNISIPDSVVKIGRNAFNSDLYIQNESNWTNYGEYDILYIGNHLIQTKGTLPSSLTIRDNIVTIGCNAFKGSETLEKVVIPESTKYIGGGAFEDCVNLKEIVIPETLSNIGIDAFINTAYYNNQINWENDYLYLGKNLIKVNNTIEHANIKDGTLSIAGGAFSNCTNLKQIEITPSVINIGDSAFTGCTNLTEVLNASGVVNIGETAFFNCTSLTEFYIPQNVVSIGMGCFINCNNLTKVFIENNVLNIEYDTFPTYNKFFALIVEQDSYAHLYAILNQVQFWCFGDIAIIFSDVTENQWFTEAVRYCNENNLMNGVGLSPDGTKRQRFSPETSMTRAQLVQVLYNMEGAPSVTYTEQFDDVGKNQWFAKPVTWAAQENIVFGKEPGLFDPDAPITRQEITTILFRYAEYKGFDFSVEDPQTTLQTFPDAESVASWATDDLAALVELHVINGNEGYLLPEANARRCEVAMMLSLFVPQLAKTETNP